MSELHGLTEIELACLLTDDEVQYRGRMLSETITQLDEIREARTAAMKEFKDRIVHLEESQRRLSKAIRSRIEMRMVRCAIQFHTPLEGVKRIVRLDTGELIREEPMTDSEKQLNLFAGQKAFEEFLKDQGVHRPEQPESSEGDDAGNQ